VTYSEDDLIPLSALQHMHFCPRQCALIHVERAWVENRFTAEGRLIHKRVHNSGRSTEGGARIVRSLPLRSLVLGVSGVADVVEFHPVAREDPKSAEKVPGLPGTWRVYPVEYKRGDKNATRAIGSNCAPRPFAWKKCWIAKSTKDPRSTARPAGAAS
jgi:CRISPR-associated exonuclease Cas4